MSIRICLGGSKMGGGREVWMKDAEEDTKRESGCLREHEDGVYSMMAK